MLNYDLWQISQPFLIPETSKKVPPSGGSSQYRTLNGEYSQLLRLHLHVLSLINSPSPWQCTFGASNYIRTLTNDHGCETSLKKWIRATSKFIASNPCRSIWLMLHIEFFWSWTDFKGLYQKKKSSLISRGGQLMVWCYFLKRFPFSIPWQACSKNDETAAKRWRHNRPNMLKGGFPLSRNCHIFYARK